MLNERVSNSIVRLQIKNLVLTGISVLVSEKRM